MRKSILLIAIFLSSMSIMQAQQLDIIPKPVKVEQKEGVFIIPAPVQIIVDKKAQKSVVFITASFLKIQGLTRLLLLGVNRKKIQSHFWLMKK
jgi:hexosaminidase